MPDHYHVGPLIEGTVHCRGYWPIIDSNGKRFAMVLDEPGYGASKAEMLASALNVAVNASTLNEAFKSLMAVLTDRPKTDL